MPDRIATQSVILEGGLIKNIPIIDQGLRFPGSLQVAQNFEPDFDGGYKRISGYGKYDTTAVGVSDTPAATGEVLGLWPFLDKVFAVRGIELYSSAGSGWTKESTSSFTASPVLYQGKVFNFTTEKLIIVNGVDHPVTTDGSTFTSLTSIPLGQTYVAPFKNHMFYSKGPIVTISAPADETTASSGVGGATLNIGHDVVAMEAFRDALYLIGPTNISKITGSSSANWVLENISNNIGSNYPLSIREVNGELLFLSQDGVRTISATDRIGDTNIANVSKEIEQEIQDTSPFGSNKDVRAISLVSKNQYRLFVSDSTTARAENKGFLASFRLQSTGEPKWEWFTLKGFKASAAGDGYISNEEKIFHGDYDGFVYEQENGDSFDGNPVTAILQFPYWGFSDPEVRKTLHNLRMYIFTESAVDPSYYMTLDYLDSTRAQPPALDGATGTGSFAIYGSAIYGTSTYSTGVAHENYFTLSGTCFNAALTISSSDTNGTYTIQTFNIQYGEGGRK